MSPVVPAARPSARGPAASAVVAALAVMAALAVLVGRPDPAGAATEKVLTVSAHAAHQPVAAGTDTTLAVQVDLHGHWHINASKPLDPLLIPTRLTIEPPAGVTAGDPLFPPALERKFEFSDDPLLVHEGRFVVRVPLSIASSVAAGEHRLSGKIRYQACDDERCLAPREDPFTMTLQVGAPGTRSVATHPEVVVPAGSAASPAVSSPAAAASATPAPAAATAPASGTEPAASASPSLSPTSSPAPTPTPTPTRSSAAAPGADTDAGPSAGGFLSAERVRAWFEGGSYLRSFVIIFLIGLALNLTPCVYPVIPLTLGYFAYESERRAGKTFSLALTYVLGMAVMYSALGVFAALSGKAFGSALSNPWVLVFEAVVMVALALSMFGLFEITVPAFISEKLSASPSGHLGALFMGLTVGIVAAPCLAPAVLGLFVLVAQMQSVALGFAIFFVLALGLGLPFLVLGTAAGAISRLPRSGEWMVWIKHVFGIVLLGMALYFLRPSIGTPAFLWGLVLLALIGALWLGWLDRAGSSSPTFRRIKMVAGLLFLAGAGVALSSALKVGRPAPGIQWTAYDGELYARAVEQGRPVLIDFTAEYCLPCKELDHKTFSRDSVKEAAERFVALRADGTVSTPHVDALLGKFDVQGYPTVVLIDSKGRERSELRVVGFLGPEEFRARLQQVD